MGVEYQPGVLAQGMKADVRPLLHRDLDLDVVRGEKRRRANRVVRDTMRVGVDETRQLLVVVRGDPSGSRVAGGRKARSAAVLVAQAVRHHLELELPDRAQQ